MEQREYRRMKRSRRRFTSYWYTHKYRREFVGGARNFGRWSRYDCPKSLCPECERRYRVKAGELGLDEEIDLVVGGHNYTSILLRERP